MSEETKKFTINNYIFSGILWILAILTLLFNALGLWEPWQLVGYMFVFYTPISVVISVRSVVFSYRSKQTKSITLNLISLVISLIFVLFTVFVSTTWFW